MPLSAVITFVSSLALLSAWLVVGLRMKRSGTVASPQIVLFRKFFFYMSIFLFLMGLPHIWLVIDPSQFPFWMAWGYVIGHIFAYISFMSIGRVIFSLIPRFASWDRPAVVIGIIATIAITIVNTVTMVYGVQPQYDTERHVTFFNAVPAVGISIAVFVVLTMLPTAILMIANGVRNPSARLRSFLLGGGLLMIIVGGPMHDNAETALFYIIADLLTVLGVLVMASGVLYRFEERLSVARQIRTTHAVRY